MTTLARPLPSLAAILMTCSVVLLGCSSDPAAAPATSQQPATSVIDSGGADATSSGGADATSSGGADPTPSGSTDPTPSGSADPSPSGSTDPTSSGGGEAQVTGSSTGTAASGGPARIVVSGAICEFLEKKIPIVEMATLSGQAADRTVEMGEDWCVYGAGDPGQIVTLQYQQDGKGDFDLLGADGTPVDTITLGVPSM